MSSPPTTTTSKREYALISDTETWTLPFFRANSGFCPTIYQLPSADTEDTNKAEYEVLLSQQRKYRVYFIQYMFKAADFLQLPYTTTSIAINYFDKFYFSSFGSNHNSNHTDSSSTATASSSSSSSSSTALCWRHLFRFSSIYDPYYLALSCLYIAGKQQETRVRLDKCARFMHDTFEQIEMERICKKLLLNELLLMQVCKFNFSNNLLNLPFDYLLPIMTAWKSFYIPFQTNAKTLKYVYCLHAFKFIKQSFYIPINILVPPQKIAIVAVELSLRLNYDSYKRQQEAINHAKDDDAAVHLNDDDLFYIDPPLQWYSIFDASMKKEEINLIANEIVNAIQDFTEFQVDSQTDVELVEKLSNFRKNTLKMDKIHKQIIEKQREYYSPENAQAMRMKQQLKAKNARQRIKYPYNLSADSPSSSLPRSKLQSSIHAHRYKVTKQAELSLAFNNQSISPASLQPHTFFTLFPLKSQCFADVDQEYKERKKNSSISPDSPVQIDEDEDDENDKKHRKRSSRSRKRHRHQKSHRKSRRKSVTPSSSSGTPSESSDDDEEDSEEEDEEESDDEDVNKEDGDEKKSNAASQEREKCEVKKNHVRRRKRKRSESAESSDREKGKEKESERRKDRKRRKIELSHDPHRYRLHHHHESDHHHSSDSKSNRNKHSKHKSKHREKEKKREEEEEERHSHRNGTHQHQHHHRARSSQKERKSRKHRSSRSSHRDRSPPSSSSSATSKSRSRSGSREQRKYSKSRSSRDHRKKRRSSLSSDNNAKYKDRTKNAAKPKPVVPVPERVRNDRVNINGDQAADERDERPAFNNNHSQPHVHNHGNYKLIESREIEREETGLNEPADIDDRERYEWRKPRNNNHAQHVYAPRYDDDGEQGYVHAPHHNHNEYKYRNANMNRDHGSFVGGISIPTHLFRGYCSHKYKNHKMEDSTQIEYGLSDFNENENVHREREQGGDGDGDGDDGQSMDDQLRQLIEFNEHKTQSNHNENNGNHEHEPQEEEEVREEEQEKERRKETESPLLKALKADKKSKLYTDMLLPSRNDSEKQ